MKKIFSIIAVLALVLSLAACGCSNSNEENATDALPTEPTEANLSVGNVLLKDFEERAKADMEADAMTLAGGLLENDIINFGSATMAVEPGYLSGFGDAEITGFEEGAMFSPMIGTIPFVGYVFTLSDGADVEGFIKMLEENADLRWNICTEADEMITGSVGNKVFFVMSPVTFDE